MSGGRPGYYDPALLVPNSTRRIDQPPSDREIEVLTHLAKGVGNKVAAAELGISEHTVKGHVTRLTAHTGADNLVGILFALGWTRIPDPHEREIEHAAHRAERARDELDALLHQRDVA